MKNFLHTFVGWLAYLVPSDEELDLSPEARKAREHTQHDMDAKRANALESLKGTSKRNTEFVDVHRRGS